MNRESQLLVFHWWASLVAQIVRRLSAMQKTRVRSLGWEDPLEEEIAAHSSILAWRIPWTEHSFILIQSYYKHALLL